MEQLHKILQFMPLNGVPGDVLQRNADGAVWQPITSVSLDIHSMNSMTEPVDGNDELPIYDNSLQGNYKTRVSDLMLQSPVQSVNGQTGDVVLTIPSIPVDSVNGQTGTVVLDASDVGALPDSTVIPENTSDLVNDSGFITAAGAPVQSVCSKVGSVLLDKTDIGLGNVDNVQQYSASNPPPYPVTSVNGMTGDVIVSGGGGSFTVDLLWTNSSPGSGFNAQTAPIDLSSYSLVMIEMVAGSDSSFFEVFVIPTTRTYNYIRGINAAGRFFERAIIISSSGVQFLSGEVMSSYDGAWVTDSGGGIPYKIYGIK